MLKGSGSALKAIVVGATLAGASSAAAQENADTREIYHIFKLETNASRGELIQALRLGLKENTTDTQVTTPLVRGEPPEKPGSFEVVNPLADGRFGALGALFGAGRAGELMQVTCEGAVWIGTGQRRLRGAQRLRMTMCLFPMKAQNSAFAYHLDMYVIDTVRRAAGSTSASGGRSRAPSWASQKTGRTRPSSMCSEERGGIPQPV